MGRSRRIDACVELTKPRITWLILMSTAVGYLFGVPASSGSELVSGFGCMRFLHTLVGTGLLASGTAALNEWYEWPADKRMRRTSRRPVPSGRISPMAAMVFGMALSVIGFVELALAVNACAACAGGLTWFLYLFVYTPLKSRTWWCTLVGAVPGALPPVIGFSAASNRISVEALALFAILFVWQCPHFYSIAWIYRDDYARGGMAMLAVVDPDGISTVRQVVYFSAALLPVSFVPYILGMSSPIYLLVACLLGLWMIRASAQMVHTSVKTARRVLITSVLYLPALYVCIASDRVYRLCHLG